MRDRKRICKAVLFPHCSVPPLALCLEGNNASLGIWKKLRESYHL